jgi:diguanylate cyclase (GGDEF)-like protein
MKPISILIVDDEPDNFDVIETLLHNQDYQLHYASSGSEAIASLRIIEPDLILLDVMMPEMDGVEVCQQIKAMEQWKAVPIIMVTAFVSKQALAKCLHMGADDFISKPVNSIELNARISSMLRIYRQYQELKTFNTQLEVLVQERTNQLQMMLLEDNLTHLPSRAYLLDKLSTALESDGSHLAIVYLDCDQFKLINGAFGYTIGNQLLQAIAQRLQDYLRPGDILARVGGDEFCFLLYNTQDLFPLDIWIQSVMKQPTAWRSNQSTGQLSKQRFVRCSAWPPPKCSKLQYRLFPWPPNHQMQWRKPAKSSTPLLVWYSNRPTDLLSGRPSALLSTWQSRLYSMQRYQQFPSGPYRLLLFLPPATSLRQQPVWCSNQLTDPL